MKALALFFLIPYINFNNLQSWAVMVNFLSSWIEQMIKWLAQGHNTVLPMRLEPTAYRSRVNSSTTVPPGSSESSGKTEPIVRLSEPSPHHWSDEYQTLMPAHIIRNIHNTYHPSNSMASPTRFTFLLEKSSNCVGDTIVICLHDTALVLI